MTKVERAAALHASGSSCSQSVFAPFAEELGLDPRRAHKLATGLGAGCGRQQLVCGAVSGAVLALGLALGSEEGSEAAAKEETYEAVYGFVERIKAEFGASDCRALLEGIDLREPAGKAAFKERGLGDQVCNPIIRRCVELLEEELRSRSPA